MIFGTNGVRGRMDELDHELMFRICSGFARWTEKQVKRTPRIAIAKDMRITGDFYKSIAISGLLYSGAEVTDIGLASSPTAEYYTHVNHLDGLVIITASHNPPEFNAIKCVDNKGLPVSPEKGAEIEKLMDVPGAEWSSLMEVITDSNASQIHCHGILDDLEIPEQFLKKGHTALFDPGNGTGALVVPQVLRELGINMLSVNSHIDGTFPGRMSEPSAKNLEKTLGIAKGITFTYGIALDGDADRLVLIDEKGNFVIGDKVVALGAMLLLGKYRKKGKVVTTVATSNVLKDVAESFGCRMVYTKVGAPYIAEAMLAHKAVYGGEEVGGLINPEFSMAKDGPYWAAKILELLAEEKKPLSSLVSGLGSYFSEKLKVECRHSRKAPAMEKIRQVMAKEGYQVNAIDGVRTDLNEKEWVIVRPSGTEEFIRIFAESSTQEKARAIALKHQKMVQGIVG